MAVVWHKIVVFLAPLCCRAEADKVVARANCADPYPKESSHLTSALFVQKQNRVRTIAEQGGVVLYVHLLGLWPKPETPPRGLDCLF